MTLWGKCESCGQLKPIGTTIMGILCVLCSRKGYKKSISKVNLSLGENTMTMPTPEQIQQLLAQNQALMARISTLETQEAQRTASVKVSPKSGNLTLTWYKHGGQQGAGSRGSWLIPSKELDGRSYIRCAGVPATLTLDSDKITITSILPVDSGEAKTFREQFVNQREVRILPAKKDGGIPTPTVSTPTSIPVSVPASTTPTIDPTVILAEAEKLMPTGLFKDITQAINAVKAKYGIK